MIIIKILSYKLKVIILPFIRLVKRIII